MEVEVVGEVAIRDGARSLSGAKVGGRRARTALVALALDGRAVPPDRLAGQVWGDEPPATWPDALRGLIRALRAAATAAGFEGAQLIVTEPAGYRIGPSVDVDAARAADRLRRAEELLALGRAKDAANAATAIGRDVEILPDVDAAWLDPHRAAARDRRLRGLLLLALASTEIGQPAAAVEAARAAVAAEPLDERAHRALIAALDAAGDRAGAVRAYDRCRAALAEELGIDPSAETVGAYLAALRSDSLPGGRASLPAADDPLLGRAEQLAELVAALDEPGIVTLTGRGGVGKSRLALEAARIAATGIAASGIAAARSGGAGEIQATYWVVLAPVAADELVAVSAALAVGAQVGADDPLEAVGRQLAPVGRVLVVLDGCEAVVDGAASLAAAILVGCPQASVLATSRVPLGVDTERVIAVGPLPVPVGTQLGGSPAAQLLMDRVRANGGTLAPGASTDELLAGLCRRSGGLPLALELIAAQLAVTPPGDLLDDLSDAGEDQLRAIVRRSYELLAPDEAEVFRRFAVLDGPVGLPMVRAVVAGGDVPPVRVVRILRELTAAGLVTADRSGARWRYQQDDDLHRFAAAELAGAGEAEVTLARLAAAVRALLPDEAKASPGPFAEQVSDVLGCVRAVFTAALDGRLPRAAGLELGYRLHRYWAASTVAEGRFWLRRLLAGDPSTVWTGRARFALGYLSYWSGDVGEALDQLGRAVAELRGVDDWSAARALIYISGMLDDTDDGAAAVATVRECIELARPLGDVDLLVGAELAMGCVLAERGDPAAADYALKAIEPYQLGGTPDGRASASSTAAMVCWQVGALDAARGLLDSALPMHAGRKRIARVVAMCVAAALALADGDAAAAAETARTAEVEATELGVEREVPLIRAVLAQALLAVGDLRGALGAARGGVEAALALDFGYPLAVGLEAAALALLGTVGAAGTETNGIDRAEIAGLLAAAADIRRVGERPVPPTLRPPVDAALAVLPALPGPPAAPAEAAALALRLLGAVVV